MLRIILIGLCVALIPASGHAEDVYEAAASTVDSMEKKFGVEKGKRRNHTKGFCFEAKFIPEDGAIQKYTSSPIFKGTSKVIGRLSHKDGQKTAIDSKYHEYGMGLEITTKDDDVHNITMNTLDFFPVETPQEFAELMRAKATGGDAVKVFKEKTPSLQKFKAHMAKKDKTLKPYEGSVYNSVNSFYLVNGETKTPVRWSFIPAKEQGIVLEPKDDFFFENMKENMKSGRIVWDMVVTIANPDDAVDNAAIQWTGEHEEIVAAKLQVTSIASEQDGKCDDINYDPLVLSDGFEPSDDPLLEARRASYAISVSKRLSEKHEEE